MTNTIKKLPKKNNATDGQKAHNDTKFFKVGRIRYNSWATKVLKACDIVIYERELVHIDTKHHKELNEIGMRAFDFVKFVVSNFNTIFKGSDNSYLLAFVNDKTSKIAAIELTITEDTKEAYKIKTATPINTERLSNKKLLCANIAC